MNHHRKMSASEGSTTSLRSTLPPELGITSGQTPQRRMPCKISSVAAMRFVFISCLIAVAVGLGFAANKQQSNSETTLATEQFEAIADRALNTSVEITQRKRMGTVTLASIASTMFPDADMWPNIKINEFEKVANNIIDTSNGRSMGIMPVITEEQLDDFETFLYEEIIEPNCPNGTGVHSFGTGIHGNNPYLNTSDNRYHETDGKTYWGSPYHIMTPYMYHSYGCSILTFNLHSFEVFGRVIDDVFECAESKAQNESDSQELGIENTVDECSTLSDALYLFGRNAADKSSPAAILIEAIYPDNDKSKLVGIISSTIEWSEVLVNVFSTEVSGVDCVLETDTQSFTYEIKDGVATVKGEGDLHDTRYSHHKKQTVLNPPGLYSNASATYTLTLYPNDALFEVYSTKNPAVATAGAILIILFTSIIFFTYDRFVRQEFYHKRAILHAKRQHVRFISHEVRTPLNAVSMGLQLLQSEMKIGLEAMIGERKSNADVQTSLSEWGILCEEIYSNTKNATDVLNDLLNYDKIESGSLSLEMDVVPICSLVHRTANEFVLQARQKGVKFVMNLQGNYDVEMDAPWHSEGAQDLVVVGDPIRISQVVRNVISNGLKFTPEKGTLTVEARIVKGTDMASPIVKSFDLQTGHKVEGVYRGQVYISIRDTGAGLSREQQQNIFKQGVQFNVNKLQHGEGSGLGLFIAKGIVDQHGGTMTVESEGLDKGTTFIISLPLFEINNKPEQLGPDHSTKRGLSLSPGPRSLCALNNLRILVVDDATMNRKLLSRLLEVHGHTTDQAENGLVALHKVRAAMQDGHPYHTVLMDNDMPKMNGLEAARAMRALGSDSYIVGVTGNLFPEDVRLFKNHGADKVLAKPLAYESLTEAWMELKNLGQQQLPLGMPLAA